MIKKLLISFFVVLLIIISIPIIYLYQLDSESLKESVSQFLSRKTHHQFKFNGDLHWQVLPNIKIKVNDVTITSKNESPKLQGHVGQLALRLSTWDLLQRRLNFRDILLKKADLIVNVSSTKKPKQTNQPANNVKKSEQSSNKTLNLALKKISIEDSSITINDHRNQYALSILSFQLKNRGDKQVFRLNSNAKILKDGKHVKATGMLISGKASHLDSFIDNPKKLSSLKMDAMIKGKKITIDEVSLTNISTDISYINNILQAKRFQLHIADGKVIGQMKYDVKKDELAIKQKLIDINTKPLLSLLKNNGPFASGHLNLEWQSKTHPVNNDFIYHTNASGKLSYDNTLINLPKTLNTVESMVKSLPKLIGQSPSNIQEKFKFYVSAPENEDYYHRFYQGSLTATFKMNQGKLNPIQFEMSHPKLKASGKLSYNLKNQFVLGQMRLVTYSIDKTIQKAQTLLNGSFPLIIKGKLSDLKAYPNMAVIAPLLINQFVKEQSQEAIKKWGNRLIDKALSKIND